MHMKVFSIFDCKTEAFAQPFFAVARGAAERAFSDIVNDANHPIGRHPADYTLFEIGEYDDREGVVVMYASKYAVGNGLQYKSDVKSTPAVDLPSISLNGGVK